MTAPTLTPKSPLRSSTIWLNVLVAAAEILQLLPIPPTTALLITNILNILIRTLRTNGPLALTASPFTRPRS